MSGVFSGDDPPPGYISVVAAFKAFQTAKRGADWGHDFPTSSDGKADKALQKQWDDNRQNEMQADTTEFTNAIMSERLEVVVHYPDGRFFTITPDHIAESMWPPSALITARLWGFPGDTTAQAVSNHEGDTLARHASRTPLVNRKEFNTWLGQLLAVPKKRAKPGPKSKVNKEEFFQEVRRFVEEEGMPNPEIDPNFRQADIERRMMVWHNEAVSESTNRTYVVEALERIKRTYQR